MLNFPLSRNVESGARKLFLGALHYWTWPSQIMMQFSFADSTKETKLVHNFPIKTNHYIKKK